MHGVNVDPLNPSAAPSPREIKALGFDSVRYIIRNADASREYYRRCRDAGLSVLGLVTNQTLESYGLSDVVFLTMSRIISGDAEIRRAVKRAMQDHPELIGLECGNEPEGERPAAWTMAPDVAVRFHNLCADEAWARGVTICVAGLVSGHPSWFANVVSRLSFDGLLVHPYDKTPAQARTLLQQYRSLLPHGKQLGVSEWTPFDGQAIAFSDMLDGEAPWGSFYFGWSDAMKDGHGLFDTAGNMKDIGTVLGYHLNGLLAGVVRPAARLPAAIRPGPTPLVAAGLPAPAYNGSDGIVAEAVGALRAARLSKAEQLALANKLEQLSVS